MDTSEQCDLFESDDENESFEGFTIRDQRRFLNEVPKVSLFTSTPAPKRPKTDVRNDLLLEDSLTKDTEKIIYQFSSSKPTHFGFSMKMEVGKGKM